MSDLFGVLVSAANKVFNKVCRVLVAQLYDRYVYLPSVDAEWEAEVHGFLENYEFPYVGAWDGFYVYISPKLSSKVFSAVKNDTPCQILA